jgi:hypothetical protein
MSAPDRETYKENVRNYIAATASAELGDAIESTRADVKSRGFSESFTPYDILWFGLAVVGAYRIGAGIAGDGD